MFEKAKYRDQSNAQILKHLQMQGYHPFLISEAPNDFLESHIHRQSHIIVLVQGQMKVQLEKEAIMMQPGDMITIDSNEKHAAYFGPKGCKYFWVEY